MSSSRSSLLWWLALSLGLHGALGWGGIFSLPEPSAPAVKIHHLKLCATPHVPEAPPPAAPASRPQAQPHPKPRQLPRSAKIVKPRPRPQPERGSLPHPAPVSRPVSPPAPKSAATVLAKASHPGTLTGQDDLTVPSSASQSQSSSRAALQAERRYLDLIRARILAQRRYPALARQRGLEGVARVRFIIDRDGGLNGGIHLVCSSGSDLLDQQAARCVLAAAPFPPLPPALSRDHLSIVVPITFRLTETGY